MSDDKLLASCTLPFISEWAERALRSHMEVLLGEAGIPLVHHAAWHALSSNSSSTAIHVHCDSPFLDCLAHLLLRCHRI